MTLIAIEGLDASGKNTQSNQLVKHFVEAGRQATLLSFPCYESVTGEMIKGHLLGDLKVELTESAKSKKYDRTQTYMIDPATYAFQCYQIVNRMENLPDAIWERDPSQVYVADRYNASAYAYGLAFGLDLDWLIKIHRHLPQPDVNIFLDITVEESFKRRPIRRDNYERDGAMLDNVRKCYLDVFKKMGPSYVVIDASGSIEQTFEKIVECVSKQR